MQYGRMREFLRLGEGAPPPIFAGRGALLADLLKTGTENAGLPKMTRVIQSAPGAGKTSILHEMRRRWTGQDGTPRVLVLSGTDLMDDMSAVVNAVIAAGTIRTGLEGDRPRPDGTVRGDRRLRLLPQPVRAPSAGDPDRGGWRARREGLAAGDRGRGRGAASSGGRDRAGRPFPAVDP